MKCGITCNVLVKTVSDFSGLRHNNRAHHSIRKMHFLAQASSTLSLLPIQYGNVTCESEDRDVSCMFEVSVTDDEHGRWALRNVTRGYFLGAAGDKLICTAKVPTDAELWTIHLAARPQVSRDAL